MERVEALSILYFSDRREMGMKKYICRAAWGAIYGVLALASSVLLVRHLGDLAAWAGGMVAAKEEVAHAVQVLRQLETAVLRAPWLWGVPVCAAVSLIFGMSRKGVRVLCGVLFFLPAVLLCLWFTEINGIRLGALLERILPALPTLL